MLIQEICKLNENYNEIIIGAGLIGLKTAQDIKKTFPENKILFLDIKTPENLKELNKIGDAFIIHWGEKEFMKEVSKRIDEKAKIYICINTKGNKEEDLLFAGLINKYFSNNPIVVRSTFDVSFFYGIKSKSKAVVPERYSPGDNVNFKLTYWSTADLKNYIEKIFGAEYSDFPEAVILAKIFENTQRYILISLMNSFKMQIFNQKVFEETIRICELKDNFVKGIHPGLIGGECIGVDNKYLSGPVESLWKAADNINEDYYQIILNDLKKTIFEFLDKTDNKGKVVFIGGEYKNNVSGKVALKNSPKYQMILELKNTLESLFRNPPKIINTVSHKTSEDVSYELSNIINFGDENVMVVVFTYHQYIIDEIKKIKDKLKIIYLN